MNKNIVLKIPFIHQVVSTGFHFKTFPTPRFKVKAWTSHTQDNKHVLFLDYDKVSYARMFGDLAHLAEKYALPGFFIFSTRVDEGSLHKAHENRNEERKLKGSFHAICLAKNTYADTMMMIRESHCDEAVKSVPNYYYDKSLVLRWSGKAERESPQFYGYLSYEALVGIKMSKGVRKDASLSHKLFMEKILDVDKEIVNAIINKENYKFDKNTTVEHLEYLTGSK